MNAIVSRSVIGGTVRAPSSKSAMQRYIAGALLARGTSTLEFSSLCDDTEAALDIAGKLGAAIEKGDKKVVINGGFSPVADTISCGESGLSARMFTPLAALHNSEITITGRGSLLKRPFGMVELPLRQLGAEIRTEEGCLPVTVKGPLKGGIASADGSLSSQFITGLLMALPVAGKDSVITVERLASKPYVSLTLKILGEFGIEIRNEDFMRFHIPGRQSYRHGSFTAEGDWSGAAFLLVMGAIAGSVTVKGLDADSEQADKTITDALLMAGAGLKSSKEDISVSSGVLRPFEFDITDCPDLAPPLTVLALACEGRSVLRGAERLVAKESNRGKALEETLNAIGGRVSFRGSVIEIDGGTPLRGGSADSFNDHRIAMSLAAAGLISSGPVRISGMECINKSYPGFLNDLVSLGGSIELI